MLQNKFSDPPEYFHDTMKDDLDLFGSDEDEIFRNLDLSRYDIEDVDISFFENSYDSEDDSDGECLNSKFREIRNHDCMWGGQCCNKEFQRVQAPTTRPPPTPQPVQPKKQAPAPAPSILITHSSQNKVVTIQKCVPKGNKCSERTDGVVVVRNNARTINAKNEGRSLLLNRTTQPQQSPVKTTPVKREFPTPHSSRPETPQSLSGSDDDFAPIPIDTHNTTSIFRSALDALTTTPANVWEDEILSYNRTKAEKPTNPSQPDISRLSASASSDHNYTGKNLRLEGLGVDTPSDSEEDEEIDVVSLSERSSSSRSSSCSGLPTRPTPHDQETLEEITTSLLSASAAVSRKLKKTITTHETVVKTKRKKYQSDSSDDDYDEETSTEYSKYHQQTKRQKSSPGSSRRKKASRFGEEEDSEEKRYQHNNMERMRRIDLRLCFEELKGLVPAVANKDRAAKVVILREAMNYCCELGAESQSKHMQVQALRKEQMRLRSMVSSLRKAAAMACVKTPKRLTN